MAPAIHTFKSTFWKNPFFIEAETFQFPVCKDVLSIKQLISLACWRIAETPAPGTLLKTCGKPIALPQASVSSGRTNYR
jgi:hypothetical protein